MTMGLPICFSELHVSSPRFILCLLLLLACKTRSEEELGTCNSSPAADAVGELSRTSESVDKLHVKIHELEAKLVAVENTLADLQRTTRNQERHLQEVKDVLQQWQQTNPQANYERRNVTDEPVTSAVAKSSFVMADGTGLVAYPTTTTHLVAKGRKPWSSYFSLLSAVRVDAEVTALHAMLENMATGTCRYLVYGDETGRIYMFSHQGDLVHEYFTSVASAVTAMCSYPMARNVSILLTGHRNGEVAAHLVVDTFDRDLDRHRILNITLQYIVQHSEGDKGSTTRSSSTTAPSHASNGSAVAPEAALELPGGEGDTSRVLAAAAEGQEEQRGGLVVTADDDDARSDEHGVDEDAEIVHIDVYRGGVHRLVAVLHRSGHLLFLRENGTVRRSHILPGPALGARRSGEHLLVLNPHGASVAWFKVERLLRNLSCTGLNDSTLTSVSFDFNKNYRVYAMTQQGELLTITLPVDNGQYFCRVWARRALGLPPGPVRLAPLSGYLLLAHSAGMALFNVSMNYRRGPPEVLVEPIAGLGVAVGQNLSSVERPLVATTGKGMLAMVSLGGGLVASFQAALHVQKPPEFSVKSWSQPLFIGVIVIVGLWQFNRNGSSARRMPLGMDRGSLSGMRGMGGDYSGGLRGMGLDLNDVGSRRGRDTHSRQYDGMGGNRKYSSMDDDR